MIACSEDDTENALIVITAKAANRGIKVVARVESEDDIAKLDKAGAYRTVMPEATAGAEIGGILVKKLAGQQ